MTGPLRMPDISVVITGRDLADLSYLVALGIRTLSRRDAMPPSQRVQRLHAVLREAAEDYIASDHGNQQRAEMPQGADSEDWKTEDLITTREAAAVLQLSERQVRNLADELGARRIGRALGFDRTNVEAENARRNLTKESHR